MTSMDAEKEFGEMMRDHAAKRIEEEGTNPEIDPDKFLEKFCEPSNFQGALMGPSSISCTYTNTVTAEMDLVRGTVTLEGSFEGGREFAYGVQQTIDARGNNAEFWDEDSPGEFAPSVKVENAQLYLDDNK